MEDTKEILKEIKELRSLITKLTGIPDQSGKEPFSNEAIEKAAKEFQKLTIARDEWIDSYSIDKYIKGAPYNVGNFIRDEFNFTNCFKRGHKYYYFRDDIIALGKELKKRNVNLGRYMELKADQQKLESYITSIFQNKGEKRKKRKFKVPKALMDINSTPPKLPAPEVLKAELEKLKEEFIQLKLSEYIDIYKGSYALSKGLWDIHKFIEPSMRKKIHTWVSDFNLVTRLILETTKKKEVFNPIPESEMIKL
ncbi:MAG: hypothetical protein ACLQQ4_13455 [Bacteroidia bacterium]